MACAMCGEHESNAATKKDIPTAFFILCLLRMFGFFQFRVFHSRCLREIVKPWQGDFFVDNKELGN